MEKKIKSKLHISDILILVVLIAYALSLILILCWGIVTSLKANTDYISGNVLGFPDLHQEWTCLTDSISLAVKKRLHLGIIKEYLTYLK